MSNWYQSLSLVYRRKSRQRIIDLAVGINNIIVEPLSVFRADANLDEVVEDLHRLLATVCATFADARQINTLNYQQNRFTEPICLSLAKP